MSLNPTGGGASINWNYSKPGEAGYTTELTGTVVAIQQVQAMNFGNNGMPTTPKFWDDGNPMWNIRFVLCGPSGGLRSWTFQPAGKAAKAGERKSVHVDLFALTGNTDLMNLIGKTIKIATEQPPQGFNYGRGNPRPWTVELVEDQGPFEPTEPLDPMFQVPQLLANQSTSGGVMQPQAPPAAQAVVNQVGGQVQSVNPAPQAPSVEQLTEDIPF